MSSLLAHIWQAGRNERLAKRLLDEADFKEWIITVSFYSAIHFVEAAFTSLAGIGHSEVSKPRTFQGSIHTWREDLVLNNYPVDVWTSYRKLRTQSNTARYLCTDRGSPLGRPAEEYFSVGDLNNFIYRDLNNIRTKLGF